MYHTRLQLYGQIFLLNAKFTLQTVVDCRLQLQVAKKIPVKPGLKRGLQIFESLKAFFLHILVQGQKLNRNTNFYQNRTIFEK